MSGSAEARAVKAIESVQRELSDTLDLRGLGLKALPPLPDGIDHIRRLNLSGNRLQDLPPEIWRLERLELLDLGGNRLRQLDPGIGRLARLESLDLSENRLATLPMELANCACLTHLDLFSNFLTELPAVVLSLAGLVKLDLARNGLASLPVIQDCFPRLEELDLSGNRISELPAGFGTFPALRVLNLSANQLASVGQLVTLERLEELSLDGNLLEDLPSGLADLPLLLLLSVDNNPLGALPSGLSHFNPTDGQLRGGGSLHEFVSGGSEPGKRYFDAPLYNFGFSLALKDKAALDRSLDIYYKEFAGAPDASIKFSDGANIDLATLGRKALLKFAHGQPEEPVSAVIEFHPTNKQPNAQIICDFAKRTIAHVPGADLILLDPEGASPINDAETASAAEHKLYFMLRGDYAHGAAICAHRKAMLEFRYEIPPPDVLAVVDESKILDEAREADVDITLQLTERGSLTLVGKRRLTAKFRGGRMLQPLLFKIQAGEVSQVPSSIHVDFLVKGETVHQTELMITVVATEAELGQAGISGVGPLTVPLQLIKEASTIEASTEHRIHLSLSLVGSFFCINLIHSFKGDDQSVFEGHYASSSIDRSKLETLMRTIRNSLQRCYADDIWHSFDGSLPADDTVKPIKRSLLRTLGIVAEAGWLLYSALYQDPGLAPALDYIEKSVPLGAVVTIGTADVFLPWEILYPRKWSVADTDEQKSENPLAPELFWGARFAIETLLASSGSLVNLRRIQVETTAKVSVNLNPTIDVDPINAAAVKAADKPLAVQEAWAERLGAAGHLDGLQKCCDEMRKVLQNADNDATLIYLYCHGNSPNPFGGELEVLQLDGSGCDLQPQNISGTMPYRKAPIVFLNSCQSGAHSPLAFSDFLKEFRRRGALGMIATSYSIPIVFAAHFGEEVVDSYLNCTGSLAVAMNTLRRRHLLECGNPVPLFYSLQCQISFPPTRTKGDS